MNENVRLFAVASLTSVSFLLGGCAVGGDESTPTQDESALSATARAYVTLRHDNRKCASPKCGGWFAKDVNKANPTERYVSALDFSTSDLDQTAIDQVNSAPDGELVLRAKLGKLDTKTNTRKLLVYEAYRGMPGKTAAAGDTYFTVSPDDPQKQCITAPCNNLTAHKLNATKTSSITRTDVAFGQFVDDAWLTHRIEDGSAIVVGNIHAGDVFPGGPEAVLSASQVFLKLPEVQGPCPLFKYGVCPSGQVRTYTRSEDRCILPSSCVSSGFCPQFLPACEEGYTLQSWTGGQFGCPQYVCDPAWLFTQE